MDRIWKLRVTSAGVLSLVLLSAAATASATGAVVEHGAGIWADGKQWGTVANPSVVLGNHNLSFYDMLVHFSNSNAPGGQAPVAQRAPGDSGYHGGNWVYVVGNWSPSGLAAYGGTVPLLTSFAQVEAAASAGYLTLTEGNPSPGGFTFFRCPLTAFSG